MRFRIRPETRRKWETGLFAAVPALFAAATAANMDSLFFSIRREPRILGTVLSILYLGAWCLAAVLLKGRAGWVRFIFAARTAALAAIVLAVTADTSAGYSLSGAVRAAAYALSVSVYGGLPRAFWLYYLLPAAQTVAAGVLLSRQRRRRKRPRAL